jgi:ATP-dependent RNA helicase DDX35
VSSATIDAEKYRQFFESGEYKAQILEIKGRMYPVELYYLKQACRNYVQKALETLCLIHRSNAINGDVLIFMTGFEEINTFLKLFSQLQSEQLLKDDIYALPLYAGLGITKQMEVFKPAPYGKRKVIVSTNIAETSITIDNIAYIIDCCFVKMKFFDPSTGIS